MPWVKIPNYVVQFMGQPVKQQRLTDAGEPVYKPMHCTQPKEQGAEAQCGLTFTVMSDFRSHLVEHGVNPSQVRIPIPEPDLQDATIGHAILGLMLQYRNAASDSLLAQARKPLDGVVVDEIVRRIRNAGLNKVDYWHLKTDDHAWLMAFLDRKLPIIVDGKPMSVAAAKDLGIEQQTVAMSVFGIAEDAVRQAAKPLDQRRKAETEAGDPDLPENRPAQQEAA